VRWVFPDIVSSAQFRRNNSPRDETIFRFWRRTPETPHGYQGANNNGGQRLQRYPETVKCEPSASS
jgi:hypothetical protein